MKVFVFDLLAYGEQLEHLKIGDELPYIPIWLKQVAQLLREGGGHGRHRPA